MVAATALPDCMHELKANVPFGRVDNFVTLAKNYGDYSETYNGVDVTVNTRLANGLQIQGRSEHRSPDADSATSRRRSPEF